MRSSTIFKVLNFQKFKSLDARMRQHLKKFYQAAATSFPSFFEVSVVMTEQILHSRIIKDD